VPPSSSLWTKMIWVPRQKPNRGVPRSLTTRSSYPGPALEAGHGRPGRADSRTIPFAGQDNLPSW
jgi:hypothetical protein